MTTFVPPESSRRLLSTYFYSGWAFFIPYLVTYLLYAWLRWPVNPQVHNESTKIGVGGAWVPCLIHLYWALHAAHAFLGIAALKIWWQKEGNRPGDHSPLSTEASPILNRLWPILPWLLLALIFWIPGVYLEWPSDPWEHLRRINEWGALDLVTTHSSWLKSSYFIPYSMLNWAIGLRQIFWLDFYYTGICLTLCWQYYRLARACDLGERSSMVFVILQALLLGNSIFSFYRYYAISSTIYAQLGAVALIRIALEAIKNPQFSIAAFFDISVIKGKRSASSITCLVVSSVLLLALIALNHPQSIGFVALGVSAISGWRLVEWKRTAFWWLVILILVSSVLFLQLYPRSFVIESCRAQGILSSWYGFNILNFRSLAGDRMLQMVGAFGLVNLAASFFLFPRNNVIAWLTTIPLVALLLPFVAIPLTQAIARHSGVPDVGMFQRMLLAIPSGLALVGFAAQPKHGGVLFPGIKSLWNAAKVDTPTKITPPLHLLRSTNLRVFSLVCLIAILLFVVPSSWPEYNRTWHTFAVIPNDLQLRDIYANYETVRIKHSDSRNLKIVSAEAGTALGSSYALELIGPQTSRKIGQPVTNSIFTALDFLNADRLSFKNPVEQHAEANHQLKRSLSLGCNMVPNGATTNMSDWIYLAGSAPRYVVSKTNGTGSAIVLENSPGESSQVFIKELMPIQSSRSYRLEMMVRQIRDTAATVYLAVAWYNRDGRLLEANIARPQGADNPRGWINGTYSYFGLVSQFPPLVWSTYGISFGLFEAASIPLDARYVRVGALLNNNVTPMAVCQLTDVRLFEKPTPEFDLALPDATSTYSSTSQAGQLSTHWPPQQALVDRGGTREIQAGAIKALHFYGK